MTAYRNELRRLSHAYRWGTLRKHRQQNVAEHQYYVAMYSLQIAKEIEWGDWPNWLMLVEKALWHDVSEYITGDIPGPVKRAIIDPEKHGVYIDKAMEIFGMGQVLYGDETSRIVKAADLLDEAFYIVEEMHMGNKYLFSTWENVQKRLYKAWFNLPADKEVLERTWGEVRAYLGAAQNMQDYLPPNDIDLDRTD